MILTQQERDKFAAYLEISAASSEGIAEQMEATSLPDVVIKKYRAEAAACRIVAAVLRATTDAIPA